MSTPSLRLVVAYSTNRCIGKDNDLPWRLPNDLAHFKAATMGLPIIMGRKTWESLGRALPGRPNLVISRNPNYVAHGATVYPDLDSAIAACHGYDTACIIGGEQIFQLGLAIADELIATEVHAHVDGDTFFPPLPAGWTEVQREPQPEENGYRYDFVVYQHRPSVRSPLPHLRPNIFSYMSGLAAQHKAVNLAQGFPDFGCDPALLHWLDHYAKQGMNQYAPGAGVLALRQQISHYLERRDGHTYDPEQNITVTAGATEALFCSILAFVGAGDEAIILEPAYDTYEPTIELAGGIVKRLPLHAPDFAIDWEALEQLLSPKTKLLILNTPHNPSGTILQPADLQQLAQRLRRTQVIVISDEVYADMVFAPQQHHSVATHSELRERSVVIGSFGKSFHITGWKVGFCAAPAYLSEEIRKIHNLTTFSVHTPSQFALAKIMQDPAQIAAVAPMYAEKRAYFLQGLAHTAWRFLPSAGSYFITADYSAFSTENDMDFCHRLIQEYGVAAIPYSAFYKEAPAEQRLIRFCFAKTTQTLDAAIARLQRLQPR